jgi:hypothetical protein
MFCLFLKVADRAVITAVLRAYDGQTLPSLPMDITLNTFLAFFTSSSKVAFTVAVNECLAQWKWNLASRARSTLYDFDRLDMASRGPWGAFLIIRKFKWRHLVTVAGCLSLISVRGFQSINLCLDGFLTSSV